MRNNAGDLDQGKNALLFLVGVACLGIVAVLAYSVQAQSFSSYLSIASLGLLISGASLLSGGLLGFLFGIPRTLQDQRLEAGHEPEYAANTNLEQISDWLTKIIVGVGLVQLATAPDRLVRLADFFGPGLGNFSSSRAFAVGILLWFVIAGFLFGYLWTRLYFALALRGADAVGQLRKELEADAHAMAVVRNQLYQTAGVRPPSQEDLNQAVAAAKPRTRAEIFYEASRMRSDNWRGNKSVMEKTIPVFRALIASDADRRYHMNFGQLGFALKDKAPADWAAAEEALSTAISIRDKVGEEGWLYYEMNRAICRINQLPAGSPAPEVLRRIWDDLQTATDDVVQIFWNDTIATGETLGQWLQKNPRPAG